MLPISVCLRWIVFSFVRLFLQNLLAQKLYPKGIEYNFRPHNKPYTSSHISYHMELKIYVLILTPNEYIKAYTAVILIEGVFYKSEKAGGLRN